MTCKNLKTIQTWRKGISSIVGGIFFLVLMTAGFTVYYVALDSQSQMLNVQKIIADTQVAKIQEDFVVAASADPAKNYQLSLQIVNTGNNPIEISDFWIINKTDASAPAERYEPAYRDSIIPQGHSGNILKNTVLNLNPEVYDIKVISSLGTIKTVEFDANGGSNVLKAQMVAIPQDVRFGENVTVSLIVTNAGTEPITEVTANDIMVDPDQCKDPPNGIFLGPTDLLSSQSTMFFWDCVLQKPIGSVITFTGNATGKLKGVDIKSNDATDSVIVRDFSAGNFGDEVTLKDELFGKPELFLIIPNPFGGTPSSDDGQGYWGVNIANPTNKTMTVSKVSLTLLRGNANDNALVFPVGCADRTNISPTTGWACPNANILTWKNPASPIIIPPQSAYPFIVKLEPASNTVGYETLVVSASTFTSLGAFGKGPYETSSQQVTGPAGEAVANVFASDNAGNIKGIISAVPSGGTHSFNVTMAELSQSASFAIAQNSQLIINIPKEWKYEMGSIGRSAKFNLPAVNTFPDGSTQIVATLNTNLNSAKAWVSFDATAPQVQGVNAKMYVFYILGNGNTITAGNPYLIGPLAETVVQVCPESGGPLGC